MVDTRAIRKSMTTKRSKQKFSRPEGAGNFDNMDDFNIVDSINTNTGTRQQTPTNAKDTVNKEYVDTADDLHVLKTGDTMTGTLKIDVTDSRAFGVTESTEALLADLFFINTNLTDSVGHTTGAVQIGTIANPVHSGAHTANPGIAPLTIIGKGHQTNDYTVVIIRTDANVPVALFKSGNDVFEISGNALTGFTSDAIGMKLIAGSTNRDITFQSSRNDIIGRLFGGIGRPDDNTMINIIDELAGDKLVKGDST